MKFTHSIKCVLIFIMGIIPLVGSAESSRISDARAASFIFNITYFLSAIGVWENTLEMPITNDERQEFLDNAYNDIQLYRNKKNSSDEVFEEMNRLLEVVKVFVVDDDGRFDLSAFPDIDLDRDSGPIEVAKWMFSQIDLISEKVSFPKEYRQIFRGKRSENE